MIKPWVVQKESIIDERGPFKIISSIRENPRNGHTIDFLRVETPDWVAVIPFTPEGDVVLVRQYRQGADTCTLEIPAGCADPEDNDFMEAGKRELAEETGYVSDDIESIGVFHPNPGMMPVNCHVFVARNVEKTTVQKLDHGEDIEVVLMSMEELYSKVLSGEVTHGMCLSALTFYLLRNRR